MPRRLHLRFEGFRGDDQTEVCLSGDTALHGLVMGVHAGVVEYFERRGLQGLCDLGVYLSALWNIVRSIACTLMRMASSTGVTDIFDICLARPSGPRRSITYSGVTIVCCMKLCHFPHRISV